MNFMRSPCARRRRDSPHPQRRSPRRRSTSSDHPLSASATCSTSIPHRAPPCVEGAVAPVCCEIGFCELGEQPLPRRVEGSAGCVKRLGGAAATQAAIRRGIEANTPTPLVLVGRHASAHGDAADTDVVVLDQPSLWLGVGIAAASEGGHGRLNSTRPPRLGRPSVRQIRLADGVPREDVRVGMRFA
jgi:hypothetical protein